MSRKNQEKKDRIAQWVYDTRSILGRFHLWLEDVEVEWVKGEPGSDELTGNISFLEGGMERLFAVTGAVTALGTQLFGRFGAGAGLDKKGLNQVKKDADAISAYAMSECLWYLSRQLPENHAIMVCLGEGLMPKAGETPEMGSNPLLGFGRVYARPCVAQKLDRMIQRLVNDPGYGWEPFYREIKESRITIWGAAIDTLENTSRFAKGRDTGPMTVLHLFDQPLKITRPYEGYIGSLFLPREVVDTAADRSQLIHFHTPRRLVLEVIEHTYPGMRRENIHVWTLRGKSREDRIGKLWAEWQELGVHLVDDGWKLPGGTAAFTESGTYAPTYSVGTWQDEAGDSHLFLCDGYAASAEAMQAASLCPLLNIEGFLSVFTSNFKLPYDREHDVMALDPEAGDFPARLKELAGHRLEVDDALIEHYREMIRDGIAAGIPVEKRWIGADDFFPEKSWQVLAVSGYMKPDPYSGAPGVEKVGENLYRVTVRLAGPRGDKRVTLTLRFDKSPAESKLVFNPLLNRFIGGEDYTTRPVKISDSGRIRNELQTLCSEALEFFGEKGIRVYFDRIPPEVIPPAHRQKLRQILNWYKEHHPIWFSWLETG